MSSSDISVEKSFWMAGGGSPENSACLDRSIAARFMSFLLQTRCRAVSFSEFKMLMSAPYSRRSLVTLMFFCSTLR